MAVKYAFRKQKNSKRYICVGDGVKQYEVEMIMNKNTNNLYLGCLPRNCFKPIVTGLQNLLLDAKYNLKITEFGLSKIIESGVDAIMKTIYVGTSAYQAPGILLNQKYDLKCDIFPVGVIVFILMVGYPPF
eukprot:276485_1